jgi:hypothetical protein
MPVFSYREDSASEDGTLMKSLRTNKGGLGCLDLLELEDAAKRARAGSITSLSGSMDLDGRPVASKLYYR